MCGRLSQYHGIHDFVAALSMPNPVVNSVGEAPLERYNVAPSTQVALLHLEDETLRADLVRWGWHPHWATDRLPPINARAEKVAHGLFFRAIWPHRAIVPIDNWFEWVVENGIKKQPYLIRHRDRSPILCATIGQFPDTNEGPGEHDGFVIITADSAGGMIDIHDRRPVVLEPKLAREWLDPTTSKERAEQMVLRHGDPTEAFEWFRVNPGVGNVRNQGAGLIKPLTSLS
ncbi:MULTISPECIES: SOS response-associated peptidase family protein [unclassified Pseudomonas]|uniref:SOS response-associated peptidase family protein n=1 Tax=unclassified Pseudomonas TaxID=196821 RepID=UPI002AB5A091|nr:MULTISPECIES: SOS response-associated peptidase family protein [unclassified Pseudomonas]MDY7560448.1 SOS response-associated peptidase family protein [Pseudomonas sp. AB6]MEA9975956.1 SOS response-associated peptidase family protein [Pseudomonas sp. RTS4]MEA9993205.1 SOS response-associated peptidase family protein [Pseudomonas sp. AA4]MEB0043110.1 SOS response-associated peptidase family protein [Pseudomonas sp. MH10]MEB0077719.1 SOS response-associated peptidase family protein [Pseudomon